MNIPSNLIELFMLLFAIAIILCLLIVVLMVFNLAFGQQYAFESQKFSFADDMDNEIKIKFNKNGHLKNFEFILDGNKYDNTNTTFSHLATNETDGSFSAYAYADDAVIFLQFTTDTTGGTYDLKVWHQKVGVGYAVLYIFDGSDTAQRTQNADGDIAVMLAIETARILQQLQQYHESIIPFGLSAVRHQMSQVEKSETLITDTMASIADLKHVRNTIHTIHVIDDVKRVVTHMRGNYTAATNIADDAITYDVIFQDKLNAKRTGPMTWQQYADVEYLREMHQRTLVLHDRYDKMTSEFNSANNTNTMIYYVRVSDRFADADVDQLHDWLDKK